MNEEAIDSFRPPFVRITIFIRNFQIWNAGRRLITIIHYSEINSFSYRLFCFLSCIVQGMQKKAQPYTNKHGDEILMNTLSSF